jgi:FkbM family methyltransferase
MSKRNSIPITVSLIRFLTVAYRRLPFRPFRGTLLAWHHAYQHLGQDRNRIATIDGITYALDLTERIDSAIYYEGCYEPYVTAILRTCVENGMVVFDIGANIGCHTLRLAALVGEIGQVIAFEPTAYAFRKLERNVALNSFHNIILEKLALADRTSKHEQVNFKSSWKIDGATAAVDPFDIVDTMTLDEYVVTHSIAQLDFIKLDVDGFEDKVISGGIQTIRRFRPTVVIEIAPAWLDANGGDAFRLLRVFDDLGYQFYSEMRMTEYPSIESVLEAARGTGAINVLLSVKKVEEDRSFS